jgi:N-acetylmuramoyl-L-alanine amidase
LQTVCIWLCWLPCLLFSQSIGECRKRFDTYLNFKGGLSGRVLFEQEGIFIVDARGKKELAVYKAEIPVLAALLESSDVRSQQAFLKWKGMKRLSARQRDSLLIMADDRDLPSDTKKTLPLQGYRVAIDPGHFSTNLKDAAIEQKYLYFVKDSILYPNDTIKLFESLLTFNTARHLQTMLEAQGATVLLTRSQSNFTSFNCTYGDWLQRHKKRMLDSLKSSQLIDADRYAKLARYSDYKLFWEFFRDYDLANRAKKINAFQPHVTAIIHFNVDETNDPWKKGSERNFTMAFIGGAFTKDHLDRAEGRASFMRLLLTDQLNRSEKLAAKTVAGFHHHLKVPVASASDAIYLKDNCLSTPSAGVFCRNLILCRKINSPLVYGESLYQDNREESEQLMKTDLDVFGIKSNLRLSLVARSYYEAIVDFLKQP